MRTSINIARLELYNLFYSPIAWVLLVILTFQCGLSYQTIIEDFITLQNTGDTFQALTSVLFGSPSSLFGQISGKLYLYLPLITMGLLSRETSSGTIKLLYSSPIRIRSIVLGKFLAMMVYNAVLLLAIATLVVVAGIHIQSADYGQLFSGLLAIYLLLCAYAAIGLFMSSLTSYQVVAAIGTIALFAALSYIGSVWQDIDFVRDLTYCIAMAGRTEKMLSGLISSKDVCYFIIIAGLFLALTSYQLWSRRESRSAWVKAGWYVSIVVLAVGLGYVTSRPAFTFYYDATATHSETLTKNTQRALEEIGGAPLEITTYVNLLDETYWNGKPDQRNADFSRWEPYLRFKPDIRLDYVYYYDSTEYIGKRFPGQPIEEVASLYAKSFKARLNRFKKPEEIRQIIDLRPEDDRYVMNLKYNGRSTFLRIFEDPMVFPSETEVAAALKRLTTTVPVIAFLDGDLERSVGKISDRDYKMVTTQRTFRVSLINQGFDVITVDGSRPISDTVSALVIADPRVAFSDTTLRTIQQYIDRGGNLLIAGEPDKQPMLNPLLAQFGVALQSGIMVQQHKEHSPLLVVSRLAPDAVRHAKRWDKLYGDGATVTLSGAASLAYADSGAFSVSPLLMTDDSLTWNKKGKLTVDSAAVVFEPEAGDVRGGHTVGVLATRPVNGKEQRVIILGDADFMSNNEVNRYNLRGRNFEFAVSIFSWFTDGAYPVDTSRPPLPDRKFTFISDNSIQTLKIIQLGVLPGILLIVGVILLIRRRRK